MPKRDDSYGGGGYDVPDYEAGDPDRIAKVATEYHSVGKDAGDAYTLLMGADGIVSGQSETLEKLKKLLKNLPDQLGKARDSYNEAAGALDVYVPNLRAILPEIQRKQTALTTAESGASGDPQNTSLAAALSAATSDLQGSKDALETHAKTCRAALDTAAEKAIPERNFWQKLADWFQDNPLAEILLGLLSAVLMIFCPVAGLLLAGFLTAVQIVKMAVTGEWNFVDLFFSFIGFIPGGKILGFLRSGLKAMMPLAKGMLTGLRLTGKIGGGIADGILAVKNGIGKIAVTALNKTREVVTKIKSGITVNPKMSPYLAFGGRVLYNGAQDFTVEFIAGALSAWSTGKPIDWKSVAIGAGIGGGTGFAAGGLAGTKLGVDLKNSVVKFDNWGKFGADVKSAFKTGFTVKMDVPPPSINLSGHGSITMPDGGLNLKIGGVSGTFNTGGIPTVKVDGFTGIASMPGSTSFSKGLDNTGGFLNVTPTSIRSVGEHGALNLSTTPNLTTIGLGGSIISIDSGGVHLPGGGPVPLTHTPQNIGGFQVSGGNGHVSVVSPDGQRIEVGGGITEFSNDGTTVHLGNNEATVLTPDGHGVNVGHDSITAIDGNSEISIRPDSMTVDTNGVQTLHKDGTGTSFTTSTKTGATVVHTDGATNLSLDGIGVDRNFGAGTTDVTINGATYHLGGDGTFTAPNDHPGVNVTRGNGGTTLNLDGHSVFVKNDGTVTIENTATNWTTTVTPNGKVAELHNGRAGDWNSHGQQGNYTADTPRGTHVTRDGDTVTVNPGGPSKPNGNPNPGPVVTHVRGGDGHGSNYSQGGQRISHTPNGGHGAVTIEGGGGVRVERPSTWNPFGDGKETTNIHFGPGQNVKVKIDPPTFRVGLKDVDVHVTDLRGDKLAPDAVAPNGTKTWNVDGGTITLDKSGNLTVDAGGNKITADPQGTVVTKTGDVTSTINFKDNEVRTDGGGWTTRLDNDGSIETKNGTDGWVTSVNRWGEVSEQPNHRSPWHDWDSSWGGPRGEKEWLYESLAGVVKGVLSNAAKAGYTISQGGDVGQTLGRAFASVGHGWARGFSESQIGNRGMFPKDGLDEWVWKAGSKTLDAGYGKHIELDLKDTPGYATFPPVKDFILHLKSLRP
ncbi:hypothetical protein Afil01_59980 [Actinorhabdospora filicis]|uniref:Uncharacterized protein n=1 Tax=Actinorhabdospora filicis TaxID=1785913 RepID=A0A9W6SUW8_9ACTN|nr:hypothetical protein [Actinorhabdospora filicis]GLZ81191.1 hypothetical protein Afil01_59980 [Actinorhabdospora filicis]